MLFWSNEFVEIGKRRAKPDAAKAWLCGGLASGGSGPGEAWPQGGLAPGGPDLGIARNATIFADAHAKTRTDHDPPPLANEMDLNYIRASIAFVLSFAYLSCLTPTTNGRPLVLIFLAIALGSFILLAGSFFFGHDHDFDHADAGHGLDGHDIATDMEPTISFFSLKVIATLTMGFGAAGAIARQYGADYLIASLVGLGIGLVLSLIMYFVLDIIYKQQASSLVQASTAIGQTGIVQTGISPGRVGEVSLNVAGQYMTFLAKASGGQEIPKGRTVKVVDAVGSELVVEEVA